MGPAATVRPPRFLTDRHVAWARLRSRVATRSVVLTALSSPWAVRDGFLWSASCRCSRSAGCRSPRSVRVATPCDLTHRGGTMPTPEEVLSIPRQILNVRRAYGDPIEKKGTVVVPVATVVGGGRAGHGTDAEEGGSGEGGGFGTIVRPAGVYVIRDDSVTWKPALDVTRLGVMGIRARRFDYRHGRRHRASHAVMNGAHPDGRSSNRHGSVHSRKRRGRKASVTFGI